MKKTISLLLIAIICFASTGVFAAEDMDYMRAFKYASVKLPPIDAPEAVLIVGEYKSGKLIDMDIINIAQPDDGYTLPSITMEEGVTYKFFVYDNLNFENELFNSVEINPQTPNRLFLAEYNGQQFERIE